MNLNDRPSGKTLDMEEAREIRGGGVHRLCGKCGGFYVKLRLHRKHCTLIPENQQV